jgi:hypothetical protein
MTIDRLKQIIEKKVKELHPGCNSYSCGIEVTTSSHEKQKIRVHAMGHYSYPSDKESESVWYFAGSAAEAIGIMDQKIYDYKKTEKIELT